MKRILTIQDISCLGRCSSTISLPVISAMGVECVPLPTKLLSAHTMFRDPFIADLGDFMLPIARHWEKTGVTFDAIYTGYLGSESHVRNVLKILSGLGGPDTLVFVDPVMGDHGRLYRGFSEAYVETTAALCARADIMVPNLTEACLMTGTPYREDYDEAWLRELLARLARPETESREGRRPRRVLALTGVSLSPGKTGVYGMECSGTGASWFSVQRDQVPASCHGTGDLFSSVSVAALLLGLPCREAFSLAADYTAETIAFTLRAHSPEHPYDDRYGIRFEGTIPLLIRMLESRLSQKAESK